ncbi:MAG: DnaJ domain-containing protein [Magnetococcales bacterium]|nr:DnaJ domain-containing protein [Magnetococcales bacterium]NGZ26671.1 DnaJ domain-containing protein [Magnetococcales bacterium]
MNSEAVFSAMHLNPQACNSMMDQLLTILQRHPQGIKEYDLLQECRQRGLPILNESSLLDTLVLFQVHFLLFHFLYLLKGKLLREKTGDLAIHCLSIQLHPWPGENGTIPALGDPLASYYLTLDHLENTNRQQVDDLLNGFWKQFNAWDNRKDALALLDLQDPVDQSTIHQRYRQLALIHHPDKGGDGEKFRKITQAMAYLR